MLICNIIIRIVKHELYLSTNELYLRCLLLFKSSAIARTTFIYGGQREYPELVDKNVNTAPISGENLLFSFIPDLL